MKIRQLSAAVFVLALAVIGLIRPASPAAAQIDYGNGSAVWYECTNPYTGQKYKQLYPCPTDTGTPTPAVGASTLSYEFDHCNSNSAIVRLKFTWVTGAETYTIWANTTQNPTPSQVVQFTASNFGNSSPKVYDNPVQLGTTTKFWVQTKNRTSSADSNTISVTPSCSPQPPSSTGPDGYTFCAKQDGQCAVQAAGMYDLAYGVNGQFVYKLGHSAPISILCDVSTFGSDPSVGNLKSCYYKLRDASSPAITRPGLGGIAQCSNKSPRNILGWDMQDKDTTYTLKKNNVIVYQTKTAAITAPPPYATKGEASSKTLTYAPKGQYIDTNVTPGTTYTYVVEASRGGVTVVSPPARILTYNCPGTPESFTLTGSSVCVAGQPTTQLRWTASSNATEYLVLFQLDKPGDPAHGKYLMTGGTLAKPGQTEVTWVFPGKQTKTRNWKVVAKNNSGELESNAVEIPLDAAACTGEQPATPTYSLSGEYGHTITGLPANHQWGVFEVRGLRLNGGTVHVKFAGDQSAFGQFSPTYVLTEGSSNINLASVPQIATSNELRVIFALTAGNNGATSPQLSSFSTTAVAVPPPTTPGPSESVISATPSTGKAPLKVEFQYHPNSTEKLIWDFGDNNSNSDNPNGASGRNVSHTYSKPGTYQVKVDAVTACLAIGCESRGGTTITVTESNPAEGTDSPPAGSATLTMRQDSFTNGAVVQATLKNTGTTDLTCKQVPAFSVYATSGANTKPAGSNTPASTVYTTNGSNDTKTVKPGETQVVEWNQLDSAGKQVSAGTYSIETTCGQTKASAEFAVAATGSVAFTTDKSNYAQGEAVTATLHNNGKTALTCAQTPDYFIMRQPTQPGQSKISVFSSPASSAVIPASIAPGTRVTISWDQKDTQGALVATGTYTLSVNCSGTASIPQVSFVISAAPRNDEGPKESPVTAPTPVATFHTLPASGTAPLTVTATAPATLPVSAFGVSVTHRVNWGDGTSTGISAGQSVKHTYGNQGSYVIRLERMLWIVPTQVSATTVTVTAANTETTALPTPTTPALNPSNTPSLPATQSGTRDNVRTSSTTPSTTPEQGKVIPPVTSSPTSTGPSLPAPTQPRFVIPENATAFQRVFVFPPQQAWNWLMNVFQLR